jgi:glycosyltransferase involved in cell wall biosynthesis
MPVLNGASYLREALESVTAQVYEDFEFIVIDDGSSDGSEEIVAAHPDRRIRFVRNERNLGIAATLNHGLDIARGDLVARMDCDDICHPSRLGEQVRFLHDHREVAVCGTWVEAFGEVAPVVWRYPQRHKEIVCGLIFECMLAHPSVMLRKGMLDSAGLRYDPSMSYAQDYDLWFRCAQHFVLSNIPRVLLKYRVHGKSIGSASSARQVASADRVRETQIRRLGIEPSEADLALHRSLSVHRFERSYDYLDRAEHWLRRLLEANGKTGIYPQAELRSVLGMRWREACRYLTPMGIGAYCRFRRSPLSAAGTALDARARLLLRAVLRLAL